MFYLSVGQFGKHLLERYIDADGVEHRRKIPYQPVMYYHTPDGEYKDIYGKPCTEKTFNDIREYKDWAKRVQDVGKDVLGMDDMAIQYLHYAYPEEIKPDQSKIRVAFIDIEVHSEEGFPDPIKAVHPVTSITHYDTVDDRYYVFAFPGWSAESSELPAHIVDKVVYIECADERKLLVEYLRFWNNKTPAAVTGWNVEGFDIPYLCNRIDNLWGEGSHKKLSPWGITRCKEINSQYGHIKQVWTLYGVPVIDYMDLYKKFTFVNRASYRLDYIAQIELKDKKLEYDGSLSQLFNQDYQKYIDYNIKDVDIVMRLDDKLKLFDLVFQLSYYAKMNYGGVMSPLKTWDAIIYNSLQSNGIIIPENKQKRKVPYEGAFVKSPVPGLYGWLAAFDLTSLYPHLIMQYNISPETIIDMVPCAPLEQYVNGTAEVNHGGHSFAPTGMRYSKDKLGIIPREIEKVFLQRKHHKKLEFEAASKATEAGKIGDTEQEKYWKSQEQRENVSQMVRKVLINSLYGALGNQYFRYFDPRNAEAITIGGQLSIKWIARKISSFLNGVCAPTEEKDYVTYIDTDSIYVDMQDFVDLLMKKKGISEKDIAPIKIVDALDKYCSTVMEDYIGKSYEELADYMNVYAQKMFMDREVIASSGLWTGKKRYALRVWDSEGKRKYDKETGEVVPKLKIMGLETQRSSTPAVVRTALEDCIEKILLDDEPGLQSYVDEFFKKYKSTDYLEIAAVSSANNIEKYRERGRWFPAKGCPGHIKGVYFYNLLAEKHRDVDLIKDGEKIALIRIREPNEYGFGVLAFPSGSRIPDEFGLELDKMIDYQTMYDKTFIKPLESLSEATGIMYEKRASLDDLFGGI